jgi:hypothetical protein
MIYRQARPQPACPNVSLTPFSCLETIVDGVNSSAKTQISSHQEKEFLISINRNPDRIDAIIFLGNFVQRDWESIGQDAKTHLVVVDAWRVGGRFPNRTDAEG